MSNKPAIVFVISFVASFVLGSFATPALARTNFAIRPTSPQAGFYFPDARIASSPKPVRIFPTPPPAIPPSATPKPTAKPTSPPKSEVVHASPATGSTKSNQDTAQITDSQTYILNAINVYRRSKGLSTVQTNSETCEFAKVRAAEIAGNFNHDGFRNRISNNSLPYPSYSQITENIAQNSNYQNVVTQWLSSSGHRENMEKDTPFVCVESSGNFYAYEGWKP